MALQLLLGCSSSQHRNGCASCDFVGKWDYDSTSCMLTFTVSGYTEDCERLSIEDANIDVTITGPGNIGPVVTFPAFGYKKWTKFKPPSATTYTAEVTLTCDDDTTVTRTYEYTTPNPANLDCNCCTEREIDYITVSGLSAAGAVLNGTWVPNIPMGTPFYNCPAENMFGPLGTGCSYYALDNFPSASTPATGRCNLSHPDLLATRTLTNGRIYIYEGGGKIHALIPNANSTLLPTSVPARTKIIIYIGYMYLSFFENFNTGACTYNSLNPVYEEWLFEMECDGSPSLLCYVDTATSAIATIGTPSVGVFFTS